MAMQFVDLKQQYRVLKESVDARIQRVLDHAQFIMGPEVAELESELSSYTGAKVCLGCANGTDALLIAMMALDIGLGDEVITSPFTFIATGEMIALLGAKPVFVDIDPETYNIDPAQIEAAVTARTRAIMPVSLFGQPAEMKRINELADALRLPVIEDAAQSFGATHHGKKSCALSTIGCTSFFPSKPLGCYGDGGAIFTNDDELAGRMRQIRVHGQDRHYHHPVLGLNGRLDTIQAAVLLAKLEVFPQELEARQQVAATYNEMLAGTVRTPIILPHNTSAYAQYTIEVDDRDAVRAAMQADGIPTAVHYPLPLHLQPVFAHLGLREGSFPVAEAASQRVLSLPMHPYLERHDMERIAESVLKTQLARK